MPTNMWALTGLRRSEYELFISHEV